MEERKEVQSRLEQDCVDAAIGRWREENQALLKMGLNTSLSEASLNSRLYEWQQDMEAYLTEELERIEAAETAETKSQEDLDRCMYGPFLRQSTPGRLAAVTILSTINSLAVHGVDRGATLATVINQLSQGRRGGHRGQIRAREIFQNRRGSSSKTQQSKPAPSQAGHDTAANTEPALGTADPASYSAKPWPVTIRVKVGAALLSILLDTAKITVFKEDAGKDAAKDGTACQVQPAFTRANQLRRGKKIGMVLPNPAVVDVMKREPNGDFLARHLPMVVEPEPWTKFDKGGFLEHPVPLVRLKDGDKDQVLYTKAAIARGDMDQMLKGLDVLGRTAWNINRPVLQVMLEAWNDGEALANMPAVNPSITIPAGAGVVRRSHAAEGLDQGREGG